MIARTEFPAFDQNCLVATAKHVTPHSCPNWIEVHVGTALNPSTTHVAGSAVEFCRLYRLLGRRQADENSFPCATILDSLKQSSSRTPTANMEWKRSNLPSSWRKELSTSPRVERATLSGYVESGLIHHFKAGSIERGRGGHHFMMAVSFGKRRPVRSLYSEKVG
jgi:hypothetical protein